MAKDWRDKYRKRIENTKSYDIAIIDKNGKAWEVGNKITNKKEAKAYMKVFNDPEDKYIAVVRITREIIMEGK
jgi:hypothetical protein